MLKLKSQVTNLNYKHLPYKQVEIPNFNNQIIKLAFIKKRITQNSGCFCHWNL